MRKKSIHPIMGQALTSLRFFAAFAVFMHHVATISTFSHGKIDYINNILNEGYAGVGFFYVLSGFIISYSYHDKLILGKTGSLEFLLLRLARIYPVHLLTFIGACVVYAGSPNLHDPTIEKALYNLLMVQAWSGNATSSFSFNGVSWSVSVEMFFYVSFLVIATLRLRTIIFITISALLSIIVFSKLQHKALPTLDIFWTFYVNPLFRVVDFLIGVIVYHIYRRAAGVRAGVATYTALEIMSLATLVAAVYFKDHIPQAMRLDIYYITPFALIIATFAISNGLVSKALSWKPLVFMGDASFSFYMTHQIIYNFYLMNVPFRMDNISDFIHSLLAIFVASALVSAVVYVYYEKPINIYLRKLIKAAHHPVDRAGDAALHAAANNTNLH